jgi:mannose-6-phosphate isomerase-like protein (cupin superfamily)
MQENLVRGETPSLDRDPRKSDATVPEPIPFTDLPGSERARRFEGKEHGANVSFFISNHATGEGPRLHRHPYEETFILLAGEATFTIGDVSLNPEPGHVLIVPPDTPHKFVNSGETRLQQVSIHSAPEMVQEDLE